MATDRLYFQLGPHIVEEGDWVRCGCCGKDVHHTAEENAHFGQVPYPDDVGYGRCFKCEESEQAMIRRRYIEPGLAKIRAGLNEANQAKLDAMSPEQQEWLVMEAIQDGVLSFGGWRS